MRIRKCLIETFFNISEFEIGVREDEFMEDIENESLDDKRKHKRTKESKRHRNVKETDEYSKESFKKMKEEIDELKRNELNRARELEELKQKIRSRDDVQANSQTEPEYALGFDKNEYLKKGFIESAQSRMC